MTPPGNLFVICAPSGAGKTSLVKALQASTTGVTISISHTTRPKRPAETNGIDYYYVSESEFNEMIQKNEFLEYATVFHYFYGTSHTWVEQTLKQGLDVILEIDWQGCQQIKKLFPDCISIFILPPSLMDLKDRLLKRNQDTAQVIEERLSDARVTVSHINEFDYIVVNADFEHALNDLQTILSAEKLLKKQQVIRHSKLIDDLT